MRRAWAGEMKQLLVDIKRAVDTAKAQNQPRLENRAIKGFCCINFLPTISWY
jgi:hypothetical protein